ncbi:acyl transferase/acyl hydrolase/lysophospholipase [Aspergillus leporis]|uniref:Acyl transferase/acyl hydrolase/lysophospholipase n=1 Tax=Aspergillus leporis TaxID=41062 RepID=A0A5N5WKJ2_9EURO|nr:acyl transferase/acyl hydrolase/lysophospholipase [Aspergillus leporis]
MAGRSINLLSLDGGGVRGLSSLIILKEIMESIDRENPPKPCDYFHMIGGSGSGGLIAIMLGRLNMDIDQCIHAYKLLSKNIFTQKRLLPIGSNLRSRAKFDIRKLELALRKILRELGYEKDVLLRDQDTSCKVFVCATDESNRKLVHMTSYASKYSSTELFKTTRIFEAGAACFANSSLFESVRIGPSGRRFHDSTVEANNPMREVWVEARGVWPSGSLENQLKCMVSIGTGEPSIKRSRRRFFGLVKAVDGDAVDPEIDTNRFIQEHTELDDENRLFRFDVPNGLAEIDLEEVDELETIAEATQDYLEKELVYKQVRRCGRALCGA